MKKLPSLVTLSLLVVLALPGCAMRVSGFVTDSVTGEPVGRGHLTVGDRFASIDSAGHYSIKTRFNTKDRFVFSARGYVTQSVRVKINQEQRYRELNVQLVPEAVDAAGGASPAHAAK